MMNSTEDQEAWQENLLLGVSRTFALTIPQLPPELRGVVGNAYLLCRLVDTIEDEPALSIDEKHRYCATFAAVVAGQADPAELSSELAPKLSPATLEAEHELVREMPRVIAITRTYRPAQQQAIERCVRIMSDGMARFQDKASLAGLEDQAELDHYCYYVAGVVGEMLTELFCEYSPSIARHRDQMIRLSISFGQGLQMTNILKDIWEDRRRGVCWLPQSTFSPRGIDLKKLEDADPKAFADGLEELLGIARQHLRNALSYTLTLPREETGIRNFCLWALGMAVLTLRRIHRNPDFRTGTEVKISRRSVRMTIAALRIAASRDHVLKLLFSLAAHSLPKTSADVMPQLNTPS